MNNLSSAMLAELFRQESNDPFLMLVTITHESFLAPIYLVNNTTDIVSNGNAHLSFPMRITLPSDDGESTREVQIEFENVSLTLLEELRSVSSPMDIKLEMVLASNPDEVQLSLEELKLRSVMYDKQKVSARLYMDSFLNVELTAETYTPSLYPGLF